MSEQVSELFSESVATREGENSTVSSQLLLRDILALFESVLMACGHLPEIRLSSVPAVE